jgi:hypothetical protein
MYRKRLKLISIFLFSFSSFYSIDIQANNLGQIKQKNIIIQEVKHDISKPLRDFYIKSNYLLSYPIWKDSILHSQSINELKWPLLKTQSFMSTQLIPFNAFQGIGIGLGPYKPQVSQISSPYTSGAAGLIQYVQSVYNDIAVFDKSSGKLLDGFPKPGYSVWAGFGGDCESFGYVSMIVKYDQLADRWILTQPATYNLGNLSQCMAISTTPDATGSYFRYQFSVINDFPSDSSFAVWPDAYYMSYNFLPGPRLCAMDRQAMLMGKTSSMQCIQLYFSNLDFNFSGMLLLADLDGKKLPPTNSPEYAMGFFSNDALTMFKYHVDFANPNNSSVSEGIDIPVDHFYNSFLGATQPHTSTLLTFFDNRLSYRLAYRQFDNYGAMVVNHTIDGNSNPPAIRWYEIRINGSIPYLFQQGTFSPDSTGRFIGSIAMDKLGNIAAGYSLSSSSVYPSIAFAMRTPWDPPGILDNETKIIEGTGSQTGVNDWGPNSSMSIDPLDDCTFWYTNEYMKIYGSYSWSTYIANFSLPGCKE